MPLHITKLAWPLYIFKAHLAHIKFSLTKSWTFKSGSLPPHSPCSCQLTVWTLVSWESQGYVPFQIVLCTSSFTSTWIIRCEGLVPPSLGLTAVSSDIRHLSSSHCKAASSLSWEYTWKDLFFFAGCRQLFLQLLFSRDFPHYRHCVSNIS